ncbi:hypothetical protein [Arthrobacter sp. CJ23]|uniref:hypothetical protein n=1 Tax=Arthrobacter sp. CJ23 TaxID=2972479 RepID=UPI00215C679B|nr:hypothetical protein [Arthrobacter sp. CJ23]UVJ40728.1 hypothetical protein NVV90_06040 [Arthrobacter sp. CJ23]
MTGTMLKPAGSDRLARVTARRVRKASKRLSAYLGMVHLRLRNTLVRDSVTGTADVVVSMTTCGQHFRTVDVALESIARGTVKPRRLILWLDDPALLTAEQPGLRRLQRRGVEVRFSRNFGPHTKYYPCVAGGRDPVSPLATADDDIIYPPRWLKTLVDANRRYPDMVHGHRVSVIGTNGGSITQYEAWLRRRDTRPGFNNLAMGASGVIYPPAVQRELRNRGELFMDVCPGADDIWLHWVALRAGIPTRQVEAMPHFFPMIPGSQATAPSGVNVAQRSNDHWIRTLYSTDDISTLAATGPAEWPNDGDGQHGATG